MSKAVRIRDETYEALSEVVNSEPRESISSFVDRAIKRQLADEANISWCENCGDRCDLSQMHYTHDGVDLCRKCHDELLEECSNGQ